MPGRSTWRKLRIRKEGASAKIVEAKEAAGGRARAGERIGLGQCRLAHILLAAHVKMVPTFSDRPLRVTRRRGGSRNPDIQSNEISGWLSRHAVARWRLRRRLCAYVSLERNKATNATRNLACAPPAVSAIRSQAMGRGCRLESAGQGYQRSRGR